MHANLDMDFVRKTLSEPWRGGLIECRKAFAAEHGLSLHTLNQMLNGRIAVSFELVHAAQMAARRFPIYAYGLALGEALAQEPPAAAPEGDPGLNLLLRVTEAGSALGRVDEALVAALDEDSDGGRRITQSELGVLEPLALALVNENNRLLGLIRTARERERPKRRRVG